MEKGSTGFARIVETIWTQGKSADATKKKRPPPPNRERPRVQHPSRVYQLAAVKSIATGGIAVSVGNEIRSLRLALGIPAKDLADAIKEMYPKFDKSLLSKVEHGLDYGICIRSDIMDALYAKFAPELLEPRKRARRGGNRLTCRISARLTDAAYGALQRQMEADGYATTQDWLTDMVMRYLEGGDGHV